MNISPYGLPFDRPVARLDEGIEVIRLLWAADGPVDYEGKTIHRLKSAVLGLSPYGGRTPPIWTAAHGPQDAGADRAAGRRLAADQDRTIGSTPTALDDIRKAAIDAGRDTEDFTPGMLGYVLLAPDEETLARCASSRWCGACA